MTRSGAPLLEVEGLTKHFRISKGLFFAREAGAIRAVDGIDFAIGVGETLGLDWAQSKASVMNPSDPWERLLVAGLARDFQQMRFEFLRQLAMRKRGRADPKSQIAEWAAEREPAIRQFRSMIARARSATPLAPDAYTRDLLTELPVLRKIAEIETRILFNLDSSDLQPHHWVELAAAVHRVWWERLNDFWMLRWRYERGDTRADPQFPAASALVVWWTREYDAVREAFVG